MRQGFVSFLLFFWIGSAVAANLGVPPVDEEREHLRAESALELDWPSIQKIEIDGQSVWQTASDMPALLRAGSIIVLRGKGFGSGPDIDFAKILFGNVRAIERDLKMFRGTVNFLEQLFYELPRQVSGWDSDIQKWTDNEIQVRVPLTAQRGPLVIQVQKRIGSVGSVWDPMTERIEEHFNHAYDVVSLLGSPRLSNEVPIVVDNANFSALVKEGEAIYWTYDYNIGLVHKLKKMDWEKVLSGEAIDPISGACADPVKAIGAIKLVPGEVPATASQPYYFAHYPSPTPIKPLLKKPLYRGWTYPSGWVGYSYSESIHPFSQIKGKWIGMTCASCHSARITYESASGRTISKVFPGIPNPDWSMKWNVLGGLNTVAGREPGPDGKTEYVDKSMLLYAVPPGTAESSIVRAAGDGSRYANDHLFSPIAIPIITRHTPLRRALSRTEMIVGFEGSYSHAEEPDGGVGALRADELQKLTAYMSVLDTDDALLKNIGYYRWLAQRNLLSEVDFVTEGEFLGRSYLGFPRVTARMDRGKAIFDRDCRSCHQENFGTWTEENMRPVKEVGTYFSPTIFHLETGSIRTAMIRDVYWTERRGLLHDGHVKNLEELLSPERCDETSPLYQRYYTLNPGTFHVPKGTVAQERATRRHKYFGDVPWDNGALYWDYQKIRRELELPPAPHPWCVRSIDEVDDLIHFLLTL